MSANCAPLILEGVFASPRLGDDLKNGRHLYAHARKSFEALWQVEGKSGAVSEAIERTESAIFMANVDAKFELADRLGNTLIHAKERQERLLQNSRPADEVA